MKIGIIGAGNVGSNLGRGWSARGHEVCFGVRTPQDPTTQALLSELGEQAQAGTIHEAAAFADVVVLAVPWHAVEAALRAAGDLSGKVLIDATNSFGPGGPDDTPSAAEAIAQLVPEANVVKAFNTIGAEHYLDPIFEGDVKATLFICGDDDAAKSVVNILATDLRFDVVDAGPLSNAALLESLARLWVTLARGSMGRDIAFRLLRG